MYYPELLELVDKIGTKDAVVKLDTYLAFLPNRSEKIITVSNVANKLELDFTIVEVLLKNIYELGLFEQIFICRCPECNREIFTSNRKDLMNKVKEYSYCSKCLKDIDITLDDIYSGYRLIKQPEIDEQVIKEETESLLKTRLKANPDDGLESLKELFEKHKEKPHDFFYNPSEAEMKRLKEKLDNLDLDYGKETTSQGKALEGLICDLFNICIGMTATPVIRTTTNQIDCTVRNDYLIPLTVYNELGSIVKVECKNEPEKTPGNTYYHKMYGILNTSKSQNEQSVGILVSRENIARTCKDLARQYFLKDNIIIINICDIDLKRIIDEKANFLDVLQEKIQTLKNNITTPSEKHNLYSKSSI
ncbi:hypothetical protein [Clostridium butyricum]|uniref:hypothetical protein n=1 Tax=Clostridium butyricum TaxID=1492 RepID=UPI002ABE5659|nr:hypothetical protein [Clostridium butyricum]